MVGLRMRGVVSRQGLQGAQFGRPVVCLSTCRSSPAAKGAGASSGTHLLRGKLPHGHLQASGGSGAGVKGRGKPVAGFFRFGGATSDDANLANCREDYSTSDAEDYFSYMGLLAVDGTYDRFEKIVESGMDPIEVILCMAVEEGDKPKIAELMKNGANLDITHPILGKKLLDIPEDEEVLALLKGS
mmetsp:Transcript_9909/g.25253  ORF Transcript_9909/g.25253 Transcript_9909/m.25253 type:complete len:186 (-) Transcript_9909:84-641(-)